MKKRPTVFAFSSDSKDMEDAFRGYFGNRVITTSTIKKPDFDHASALVDILFLMGANKCLLTYRSTFSFLIMSSTAKRGYFLEKESGAIFKVSNSQVGAISMLFHYYDNHDWQTSRRFVLLDKNEESLRYFFNYFMI